jgi:hypothetical protein
MRMRAFPDIAPCSLVEEDLRFRGAYCLHHQDDDGSDEGGGTHPCNVSLLQRYYMVLCPRKLSISSLYFFIHKFAVYFTVLDQTTQCQMIGIMYWKVTKGSSCGLMYHTIMTFAWRDRGKPQKTLQASRSLGQDFNLSPPEMK